MDQSLRRLIHDIAAEEIPEVPPLMIEAQVLIESKGDPLAMSPAGAVGLMQLMPKTAKALGVAEELLPDPEINLRAGCRYLRAQLQRFPEIGLYHERLSFALASYNGGRGWVNKALQHARLACGQPARLSAGPAPGPWQTWAITGPFLHRVKSRKGKRPDAEQMLLYVARIRATFGRLRAAEEA